MKIVKGCQKRIYHLKNIGGYFDEAYFIFKKDFSGTEDYPIGGDLATEAERIIRGASEMFSKKKRKKAVLSKILSFALGVISSSTAIGVIALILR